MVRTHNPSHDTAVSIGVAAASQRLLDRVPVGFSEQQKVEAQDEGVAVMANMDMTVKIFVKFARFSCLLCIHQVLYCQFAGICVSRSHSHEEGIVIAVWVGGVVEEVADGHHVCFHNIGYRGEAVSEFDI